MSKDVSFKVLPLRKLPARIDETNIFRSLFECHVQHVPGYPPTYTTKNFASDLRRSSRPLPFSTYDDNRSWRDLLVGMLCIGDHVVASCFIVQTRENQMFHVCTVESVGVHPEHRGAGHCKSLMQKTIEHLAHNTSFRAVRIHAHANNQAACRCYESVFGTPVRVSKDGVAFEVSFGPHKKKSLRSTRKSVHLRPRLTT